MNKDLVLQALDEAQARLSANADGRLSRTNGRIYLSKLVRVIAESAVSTLDIFGRTHLLFRTEEDCFVPANTASAVGVVVNELVMNAIKYAHPSGVAGRLLIGCNRHSDAIVVEIVDDGVGLPEGFDPMVDGKLGFQLARSAAAQVNARLTFVDTGLGLLVRLGIPT